MAGGARPERSVNRKRNYVRRKDRCSGTADCAGDRTSHFWTQQVGWPRKESGRRDSRLQVGVERSRLAGRKRVGQKERVTGCRDRVPAGSCRVAIRMGALPGSPLAFKRTIVPTSPESPTKKRDRLIPRTRNFRRRASSLHQLHKGLVSDREASA